jgi:hypothetical protein
MTSQIGTPLCLFHPNPEWNRGLPGIDFDRADSYVPLFAGAPRAYADNEGWQFVKRRGKNLKKYRTQKRKATEAQIAAADNV